MTMVVKLHFLEINFLYSTGSLMCCCSSVALSMFLPPWFQCTSKAFPNVVMTCQKWMTLHEPAGLSAYWMRNEDDSVYKWHLWDLPITLPKLSKFWYRCGKDIDFDSSGSKECMQLSDSLGNWWISNKDDMWKVINCGAPCKAVAFFYKYVSTTVNPVKNQTLCRFGYWLTNQSLPHGIVHPHYYPLIFLIHHTLSSFTSPTFSSHTTTIMLIMCFFTSLSLPTS